MNEIRKDGGLQKACYGTDVKQGATARSSEWVAAIGIIAIGVVLYRMVLSTGVIDGIGSNGTHITFGVALLIGVVASLSTCTATVGSMVIAFAQKYAKTSSRSFRSAAKPHLAFHIGRIGGFFILGGLLGMIGGTIHIGSGMTASFNIAIAVIMAWLGLNILGLVPSIARVGIRMPERMTNAWSVVSDSTRPETPFILGGLSFFLPCGFTQSMQLFALASGSAWIGGVSMALFAVGTMPALMSLGVMSSWSSANNGRIFKKVAGMVVLLFAISTFSSGYALLGAASMTTSDKVTASVVKEYVPTGNEQEIHMKIVATGFAPDMIEIKKGVPVKWVIDTEQTGGCASRIIIPSLNIEKDMVVGENVVYFTPTKSGELPFSCWMGMVRGKFIVK